MLSIGGHSMTEKQFTVVMAGRRVQAIRHDKQLPRFKRAANAKSWRGAL